MLVLMAYFFFHPVTGVYCCHWWFNFNILLQILSSFAVIQNFPSKHFFVFQDICFEDVFSIITFHPPRRLEDDLEDKKMSWSWWDSLSISILLCLDMEEILFWFLFFFVFFFIPSLVFIRWYPDFKIFRDNSKFRLQFWFDLNVFVKLFTNFNNFCSNPNFFYHLFFIVTLITLFPTAIIWRILWLNFCCIAYTYTIHSCYWHWLHAVKLKDNNAWLSLKVSSYLYQLHGIRFSL